MNDGGAYAIYHSSLGILSQGIELKILAMDLLKSRDKEREIPAEFIVQTKFESVVVDNRIKPLRAFINLFGRRSYFTERFYSEKYCKKLTEILQQNTFDIIQLEHLYLGLYIDVIRKYSNAKIVLRAQNVENQLWYGYLDKLKNPFVKFFLFIAAKRLEIFEKQIATSVDGIMSLSDEDALYFKDYSHKIKIAAIPTGLNIKKNSEIDIKKRYEGLPILFHLGSMDWKPNVLGLKWFIKEVLPLLKKNHPEIQLIIAGKNMPPWFFKQADRNLIVQGMVKDATLFQEDKAILIVPLLTGSGIRIKILESMALGKTIISTRVGASGITYEDGKNILIANDPKEFSEQIRRCILSEDLCRSIGKNAQILISEKYELNKIGAEMSTFYAAL